MVRLGLQNILFNLLYITIPFYLIFLFNGSNTSRFFIETRDPELIEKKKRWVQFLTLLGMLIVVLMMAFPVKVISDHKFDMREIPIILGFLYIGRKSGLILIITMIVTRFLMGGTGVYGAILTVSFLLMGLFMVESHFKKGRVRTKILLAVALSVFASIVSFFNLVTLYHLSFQMAFEADGVLACSQSIGVFIAIYSIEKFKNDQFIRDSILKAEKSQIVSDLAASVSHEVRNPLTVTKGFLQMTLKEELPQNIRDYLELALDELGQAERIINDYLTFAKPALERPVQLDLSNEVDKVVQFFSPYANLNGLIIETHLQKGLTILGESQKFHQCLSNLIKNSIEASPNGGRIIIETSQVEESALISIIDNGTGMTDYDLRRIGEPYYSTKEKGTGLGMMVVHSIVKSMKGSLKITSQLGRGTECHLKFPLVQKEEKTLAIKQAL